jgi:hypothetical protein
MIDIDPQAATLAAYEAAEDFWELVHQSTAADVRMEKFYAAMRQAVPGLCVDYGVGVGAVAQHTQPDIAVDISAGMINHARRRSPATRFIQAPIQDVDIDAEACLSYIAGNTLNHLLTNDDLASAFDRIRHNSSRGGILAFDILTPEYYAAAAQIADRVNLVAAEQRHLLWNVVSLLHGEPPLYRQIFFADELDVDGHASRRYFGPFYERPLSAGDVEWALRRSGWRALAPSQYPVADPCHAIPVKSVVVATAA